MGLRRYITSMSNRMSDCNEIRCYKCNRLLVEHIEGKNWKMQLTCPRCKMAQELCHTDLEDTIKPISIAS